MTGGKSLHALPEGSPVYLLEADEETIQQWRRKILSRLQGKYAGLSGGSEEFSAQKAEEKVREEHLSDGYLS